MPELLVYNVSAHKSHKEYHMKLHREDALFDWLEDKDEVREVKHYITRLCSQKNPDIQEFCMAVLEAFITASLSHRLNDQLTKSAEKWDMNLNRWCNDYLRKVVG